MDLVIHFRNKTTYRANTDYVQSSASRTYVLG